MKKALICLLLMLLLVLAGETHVRQTLRNQAVSLIRSVRTELLGDDAGGKASGTKHPSYAQQMGGGKSDLLGATLYYRFADTGILGAQRVQLDIRREETVATHIVQRLVEGPDVAYVHLSGVFPQGTRVISVSGEGTTAYVTLSREFLGRPDGAPADWEDLPQWQEEAALRRRLAMQSIVLALTEEARFQRVQLYVADGDDEIPERVEMAYFDLSVTDPTLLLAACPRDEQAMLTPARAMNMIMEAWRSRDWASLYPLVTAAEGETLGTLGVFEAEMNGLDITLLTYDVTTGAVSFDGQTVTVVLDAQIRSRSGGDAQIVRESVPLVRVRDNWAIRYDKLLSLMIRE